MKYGNTVYYYITNLQGDVMYIVNGSGQEVAAYTYDPYGNVLSASGSMAEVNPLRYRGYYYDSETGFYYLQSRYYDPELGRFINADAFTSTGQGLLSNNMFAYCLNNPVNGYDSLGMWTITFSFGFDMTLFFFGLAISLGIAVDDNGNLAIQGSYCEPNYLNDNKTYYVGLADIGTTGSFQWTDDDTIFDLEGPGTYVGGSAGVAQYFSADLVYSGVTADDENGDALPNGFQINYGFGLGIDVHYRQTQTETICVIFGG